MINKATAKPNSLIIRRNRIGVNCATAISHILQEKENVCTLDLHENVIRDAGCIALCQNLLSKPNCYIQYLDIGSNDISTFDELASFLGSPQCRLKTLILGSEANDLYCNKFDHHVASKLCTNIKKSKTLEHLDLNRNSLMGKNSQIAFKIMASWFSQEHGAADDGTNVNGNNANGLPDHAANIFPENSDSDDEDEQQYRTILNSNDNRPTAMQHAMGGENADFIPQFNASNSSSNLQISKHHTRLHTLKLAYCCMHTSSALNILNTILSSQYFKLRTLDFGGNQLQPDVCKPLAEYLSNPLCILQSLSLNHNNLGKNGIEQIAHALETNNTLMSLNIARNNIGNAGAQVIANLLTNTTTLLHLNLKDNEMGVESCKALAKALSTNNTVRTLLLSKNKLQDDGLSALGEVLQQHESLNFFDVSSCSVGDKGALAIVVALGTNHSMHTICIRNNHLTENSGKAFLEILQKNCDVTHIDLRGNQIEHASQLKIRKALKHNKAARLTRQPESLKREVIRLKYTKHLLEKTQVELANIQKERNDLQLDVAAFHDKCTKNAIKDDGDLADILQNIRIESQTVDEIKEKRKATLADHQKWERDCEEKIKWLETALINVQNNHEERETQLQLFVQEYNKLLENQESGVDELKERIDTTKRAFKEETELKFRQMKEIAALKEELEKFEEDDA